METVKTTTIRATSRTSIKVHDSFYTVEYMEERSIPESIAVDDGKLAIERDKLWNTCNKEVDNQIEEIIKTFSKKR